MPAQSASTPLMVTLVAPGEPGAQAVAQALELVAAGENSVALIPQYAPVAVRRALQEVVAGSRAPSVSSVCVPTSGSTGFSRMVAMPWETLRLCAHVRDEALGGPAGWLLALPPATAGGVVALSRSLIARTPFGVWPGVGGSARFSAEAFIDSASQLLARTDSAGLPARVSVVSAQLATIMAHADGNGTLAAFDTVLVGGGPLAPRLRAEAEAAGASLVHSYGLTETCGGCVYDGRPVAGTQVAVADDGEILVHGSTLAAGYLDGPLRLRDGWLGTGDRGTWDGDRLTVSGRVDEIVVVRGANVDVAAVARVVTEVPGVVESAVIAVDDPAGGHLLEAHIVGSAAADNVRSAVAAALGAAAVPKVIQVLQLPRNQGGKVDLDRLRKDAL